MPKFQKKNRFKKFLIKKLKIQLHNTWPPGWRKRLLEQIRKLERRGLPPLVELKAKAMPCCSGYFEFN